MAGVNAVKGKGVCGVSDLAKDYLRHTYSPLLFAQQSLCEPEVPYILHCTQHSVKIKCIPKCQATRSDR